MSKTANIYEPELEHGEERPGFTWQRARLGRRAGGERLGASLFEMAPGNATFPYHFHFANEELLIVLRGRPHLRTPEGWRQLDEGEVVSFPVGDQGAHQVVNRGSGPVRILLISEMAGPEVVVYPDTGKVAAREHPPGSARDGLWKVFRSEAEVDYWDGEPPPEVPT